ncbi:MAG: hypothetical protein ACRDS1_10725 [Pseudonocardiaceae bacterium]
MPAGVAQRAHLLGGARAHDEVDLSRGYGHRDGRRRAGATPSGQGKCIRQFGDAQPLGGAGQGMGVGGLDDQLGQMFDDLPVARGTGLVLHHSTQSLLTVVGPQLLLVILQWFGDRG